MLPSLPMQAQTYISLAEKLFDGHLTEPALPGAAASLPKFNLELLECLAGKAYQSSFTNPKRSWAIMAVAYAAARLIDEPLLQALAAWHLARAANEWCQLTHIDEAIGHARPLFITLGEDGWVAACDWQRYAQPWLRNDYHQAAQALTQALDGLVLAGFQHLIPHCRLSLAYAYILMADFAAAEEHLTISEQTFQQSDELVNLARCWLHRASALRRQLRFPEALRYLEQALPVFSLEKTPIDLAKTWFQFAYCQLDFHGDYQTAERLFTDAANLFAERDVELWQAFCLNGLVQVYNNAGRLAQSYPLVAQIKQIYGRYPIIGPQADNALESGVLAFFRGDYTAAADFFQQAEEKYQRLKLPTMVALSIMYQGDAHSQAGHYRQALHYLEEAYRQFQALDDDGRLADCQTRLAHVWLELNRPEVATSYLDEAAAYYERTRQPAWLVVVDNHRARLFFRQSDVPGAVASLRRALSNAERQGGPLLIARSQRLLGEALSATAAHDEALAYLLAAAASFAAMDAVIEEAACQLALGHYYLLAGDATLAQASWTTALALNQGVTPEIMWQAHAGLAELATRSGDTTSGLEQYRQAVSALTRLRRSLWQPALAGSYLSRPAAMLDQAVALAVHTGSFPDALHFIEESKAHTVAQQLVAPAALLPITEELTDLAAEIRWLQQKVRDSTTTTLPTSLSVLTLHRQLIQKVKQYDLAAGQLERAGLPEQPGELPAADFDLAHFRHEANAALGSQWIALNAYQTENQLVCTAVTPASEYMWANEISNPIRLALRMCTKGGHGRSWSGHHLTTLGNKLLPEFIQERLTPETYLLIAPHRELHRLPWAALHIGYPARALVVDCIPVIVPSWHSLLYIWQRDSVGQSPIHDGLVVAVSDFQGRHAPLPQVIREAKQLASYLRPHVRVLRETSATVANLGKLAQEDGLSRFDFLHVASHAFPDQLTGRLSGLALYDRDLWLDELHRFAPLPRLVALSACSGILSRVYEGDEHVGLAVTCLAAGAQSVVGSLWPILDEHTPDFMLRLYQHLGSEEGVARALALAQRSALQSELDITHWGSFQCIGRP